MELRKLSPADMQQVRNVWKTCFQDTDAFIDTYFTSAVSIENGMGFFDAGKLLSDMFMFDITADISGMTYPSQFIAGCATLPEARNQHLMRDLIRAALTNFSERKSARAICTRFCILSIENSDSRRSPMSTSAPRPRARGPIPP